MYLVYKPWFTEIIIIVKEVQRMYYFDCSTRGNHIDGLSKPGICLARILFQNHLQKMYG